MSAERNKLLKMIHVARRELRMDRDTYLAMVRSLPGLSKAKSSTDLSESDMRKVIDALKSKGFKVRSKRTKAAGKPHNFDSAAMPAEITKIEALLASMGLSWAYADAIAKRQSGLPKMAWVRDRASIVAVLAALHVEQEKRGLLARLEHILSVTGHTNDSIEQQFNLPKGWQRRRKLLQSLIDQITPVEDPHE